MFDIKAKDKMENSSFGAWLEKYVWECFMEKMLDFN